MITIYIVILSITHMKEKISKIKFKIKCFLQTTNPTSTKNKEKEKISKMSEIQKSSCKKEEQDLAKDKT